MTATNPAWEKSADRAAREAAERKRYGGYTLLEADMVAMNPVLWAKLHGKVPERVTKDPVPFVPSVLQQRMFAHYAKCQSQEIPCRMVVVKIRRGGGSTGASALLHLHAHNYQARLGSVGTDETVAMNMFAMMRFFDKWDDYPCWKKASKILETGVIDWPNGSKWEHYTAENPESARSAGLQGYHATEVGRWQEGGAKDAGETLKSMLGAVPRRGFTVAIEESTAQGAQGAFFRRWSSARWPTAAELSTAKQPVTEGNEYWRQWEQDTPQNVAESDAERALQFVRVFAAWFEDDENRPENGVTQDDIDRIKRTLDEKELDLIRRYKSIGPQGERLGRFVKKATLWEQLAWRRAVIATEFEGDVEGFEQENPSSPKEAFAASGRHTFNRAGCAYMMDLSKSCHFRPGILVEQHDKSVIFRETGVEEAWLNVYQEPRECNRYIIGLDTCGGASNVKGSSESDFNACHVVRAGYVDSDTSRKYPHAVVASLRAKNLFDPDVLAEKVDLMSRWYGGCLVVFEVNNTGAAYRQEALKLGTNLYREQTTDTANSTTTERIGWTTSTKTRPLLIATLKKHIRNNASPDTRAEGVEVKNIAIATEATEMIQHPNGKDAAPTGKHDDQVLALGMALECISGATYLSPRKRRNRGPADRDRWTKWKG